MQNPPFKLSLSFISVRNSDVFAWARSSRLSKAKTPGTHPCSYVNCRLGELVSLE
ncbi:hypothetical protein DEO72_LG8g829 [Vigna unguiculata]|uniref:Uncharacterized protein n=1 Tax=Vigna unguiculata TaxID=3917 RepID=A0A4D6MPX2_VIGUN|nr:hypothetical protein DEO72_LG8g829 [Vigna unguiculata]